MFAGMMLILGCVIVAVLVVYHSSVDTIPPKAKLLCEVWHLVEEDKRPALQTGRIHIFADESDQSGNRNTPGMN